MELVIYALALGFAAAFIVPIFFAAASRVFPATIKANALLPTTYPRTGAGIFWSIVLWGVFLGFALWLVSLAPGVGKAVRQEA